MAKAPYAGPAWQTARRYVLARDGYRCQLHYPGCTLTATAVDHIQEITDSGAWYDPTNLQAACTHCNTTKENERRLHNNTIKLHSLPPAARQRIRARLANRAARETAGQRPFFQDRGTHRTRSEVFTYGVGGGLNAYAAGAFRSVRCW